MNLYIFTGREWLVDGEKGMVCQWCTTHEAKITHLQRSRQFILGTLAYKADTIAHHENSKAHRMAAQLQVYVKKPEAAPAVKAFQQLNQQHMSKMQILFRNAQALAKYRKPFRDYSWLCQLDEAKGLTMGNTYRSKDACRTFVRYVAQAQRKDTRSKLDKSKFFSVTSDGATDAGINEQEAVFVRTCIEGIVTVLFVGFEVPTSPDAEGIYLAIKKAIEDGLDMDEQELKKKLVGFGCDGAAVMVGAKGGVSALLKQNIQPCMVTVHCFAHRLELSYKDSIKKDNLYDDALTLLMGLYYFYHNSPKQHQNLRRMFEALQQLPAFPTRVGGTRWVGHMVFAIETFFKSYKPIVCHLEDVSLQKKSIVTVAGKARGFLKLSKRKDVLGYLHILLDMLKPLNVFHWPYSLATQP